MIYNAKKRVAEIEQSMDLKRRYVDLAIRFVAYKKSDLLNKPCPTGRTSKVYGGRWDLWSGKYVDEKPELIFDCTCSEAQLDLIEHESPRIEAYGGRGSGKSEGGVLRTIRYMLDRPGEDGQVVSPIHKQSTIVWYKFLDRLPMRFFHNNGSGSIKRYEGTMQFANGFRLRFMSSDNPESLRSWGGSIAFIDEGQDVTDHAINIVWPSLRNTDKPRMWSCGTPKPGEYYARYKSLQKMKEAKLFNFSSYSNPFISHFTFDLAKSQMDDRLYRQEVLAEWVFDDEGKVYDQFRREVHCKRYPLAPGSLVRDISLRDFTGEYIKRKTGHKRDFLIGVDYNFDTPNIAVVYKILNNQQWWAIDMLVEKGNAGHLATALKQKGYANGLVIDDASGEYSPKGKSSSRLMREAGFTVAHTSKNPKIWDRINAVNVMFAPSDGGDPKLFIDPMRCELLAQAFADQTWDGGKPDKKSGLDHYVDAAGYPISFYCPAAFIKSVDYRGHGSIG